MNICMSTEHDICKFLGLSEEPVVVNAMITPEGGIQFVDRESGRESAEFKAAMGERPSAFKALVTGDALEDNILLFVLAPTIRGVLRVATPYVPGIVFVEISGDVGQVRTLVRDLARIEKQTKRHMRGVAVELSVGTLLSPAAPPAHWWELRPLPSHETEELRGTGELSLTRLEEQVPRELPPLEDPEPHTGGETS